MNIWDKRYFDRVGLLVQVLPILDSERRFALKGGTAISLSPFGAKVQIEAY